MATNIRYNSRHSVTETHVFYRICVFPPTVVARVNLLGLKRKMSLLTCIYSTEVILIIQ